MQNVDVKALAARALRRGALHVRIALYQMCAEFHMQRTAAAYRALRFAPGVSAHDEHYQAQITESGQWIAWAHKNMAIARSKLLRVK